MIETESPVRETESSGQLSAPGEREGDQQTENFTTLHFELLSSRTDQLTNEGQVENYYLSSGFLWQHFQFQKLIRFTGSHPKCQIFSEMKGKKVLSSMFHFSLDTNSF